ncbi:MAG: nitronate monooxygenase [Gemmatimonadota bacterium]
MNDAPLKLDLFQRIGVRHPIIQAPMGGGPTTPDLVAAVAEAGALGSIAGGYLEPDQLRDFIGEVQRRTDLPIAVNLFAGDAARDGVSVGAGEGADPDADPVPTRSIPPGLLDLLARWHHALGLPPPEVPTPGPDHFLDKIEVILGSGVRAFSFTFGIPGADVLRELRRQGVVTMGTCTTVEEARLLERARVDAVVAQGSEAGAHRGTFAARPESALIGTIALVPQVADAVRVPVIASGGIMDGRGIAAARILGAGGVQMGTAFLLTPESGVPEAWGRKLRTAQEDETVVTRAFSGKPARGIRNAFIEEVEASGATIPPYPLQNDLTRGMRRAAADQARPDALSLWAGQGVRMARELPAGELVRRLVEEAAAALGAVPQP